VEVLSPRPPSLFRLQMSFSTAIDEALHLSRSLPPTFVGYVPSTRFANMEHMTEISSGATVRILLIDDHVIVRRGIRTLLEMSSPLAQIDEASSFDEAIALVERNVYTLTMLDLDLSREKSGLDILDRLRELDRGLPAIVLSGHDDRATVMQCLERGASGFIAKSSDEESVLRTAIDVVLAGRVYLPSSALGKGGSTVPSSVALARPVSLDGLNLSPKLKEALMCLYQGMSNKAIAKKMNISPFTARDYCSDLYREFGVTGRAQLVVELARQGIAVPHG
jgi:two-component system, NarL family, nitrate/nitrite response regulator NarL